MNEVLVRFVHDALAADCSRDEIEAQLRGAGWPEDEIAGALGQWVETDFPVPVPKPQTYGSAREAFLYLVQFSTLYTAAIGLGRLLFVLIDRALPDAAAGMGYWEASADAIRSSTAALLIAFPVFLWVARSTHRATRLDPERRTSKVRKWLTYLTLFVAAGVLVGDLISLVYGLLGGELTLRFLLKTAVVGAISGAVLGFYLWDLKRGDLEPSELPEHHRGLRAFAGLTTAAVVAAMAVGLVTVGSPGRARDRAIDRQRVADLQAIAAAVDGYWADEATLPPTLTALDERRGSRLRSLADPETAAPYEYRAVTSDRYRLCALFATGSEQTDRRRAPYSERFWEHPAGRHCFDVVVDKPVR